MLTVVVALQKHTGFHNRAALSLQFYNGVRASCSSPLHRLLSLDRSTSVLSDASQPRGASKWRGDRWKEQQQQQQHERERTQEIGVLIICCPCVSFFLRAENQQQDGGRGLQPVLIPSVLFMLLTHMWYWCMFTGAWQSAVSEERASSTAQLPPPTVLSIHGHLFFSVDVNIFWPSHFWSESLSPCFVSILFSPLAASHHPHLFFFFVTLVAVLFRNGSTENRPVTLRSQTASSARVAHAQRTAEATRNLCPPSPEPFWPQGLSYHKL